ncbi:MAG: hypothetical protein N3C12_11990 [Candidatus Binatia bacterium]|nr:hypothetical protein [Candidatus Binatia bacterium]
MAAGRIVFVTGKGGVGKTTITAALGLAAASAGLSTLVVETAADGSLARLFNLQQLGFRPRPLVADLAGVAVDPQHLVRDYFSRLLKIPFLVERLLQSTSFRALTDAAPGVVEFLLLEHLSMWVDAPFWHRRQRFDLVLVDGPASGHMRKLLQVPRQLLNLVLAGPLRRTALHLEALLADPSRCLVVPVTLAEELAVQETLENWAVLRQELFLNVSRPVVNRVHPRRFSTAEIRKITSERNGGPLYDAARYAIAMRQEAERLTKVLHKTTGKRPTFVGENFAGTMTRDDLQRMGSRLLDALLKDAGWLPCQRAEERDVRP